MSPQTASAAQKRPRATASRFAAAVRWAELSVAAALLVASALRVRVASTDLRLSRAVIESAGSFEVGAVGFPLERGFPLARGMGETPGLAHPNGSGQLPATLGAAVIEWACSHLGPGGGCNPRLVGPPQFDPVRLTCPTCTASRLIALGFGIHPAQIKDAPRWCDADVYRLQLVATAPASKDQLTRWTLQAVSKAFDLTYHVSDERTMVYRLTVGEHGPKFKASSSDGHQDLAALMAGVREYDSVEQLVKGLNSMYYLGMPSVQHPVEDATGLKGNYAIRLLLGSGTSPSSVNMLALVKEQLGLDVTLVPGHAHYVVIDHIHRLNGRWTYP